MAIAAAVAAGLSTACSAGTINMIVGNVDVQFVGGTDGGLLHEVSDPDFGPLDPTQAQGVSSTEFEVDSVTPPGGLLMDPPDELYVDMYIPNLGNTLGFGSLIDDAGGPGTIDWFTDSGEFLQLTVESINYTAVDFSVFGVFSFFAEAKVAAQNLPLGLEYQEDVLVSYIATDAMFLSGGSLALASGALTITGEMIPEPTTAVLAVLGGLAACCRRR